MSTRHGRLSASSAEIAASSSMRLLVVCASPPLSSFLCVPNSRIAPQPPGPGLPEQAPSVWMTTCGSLISETPLPVGHSVATLAQVRSLPRPKSDVSDFDQLLVPNSGKPEFGREREQTELVAAAVPSSLDPVIARAPDRLVETQL